MRGIEGLPAGDVKSMQGHPDGRRRLRIGKYRVVFLYTEGNIFVIGVGLRGEIYKQWAKGAFAVSAVTKQISDMIEMLPEQEQALVFEIIKRMVLAWDPDFTKETPGEAALHAAAMEELARGEGLRADQIDWDSPEED